MIVVRSLFRVAGAAGVAALAFIGSTTADADPGAVSDSGARGSSVVTQSGDASVAIARADRSAAAGQSELLGAYQSAVDGLQRLGVQPFMYPSAAAFCRDDTTLGLVPALVGAAPGPWPRATASLPGLDWSAVKSGQTMFAFVPYGLGADGTDTSGMQVAWLNASTGRGGFAPMGTLSQVVKAMVPPQVPAEVRPLAEQAVQTFFATALPSGGVRAVPVNTGTGTVLAAVFGSVRNGNRTCVFLPTVGITEVH